MFYKRATFVAHLPVRHRYTASHAWLGEDPASPGLWRVGLTRFALRMLGELVEVTYELGPGAPVCTGDIVGNIEGFKALSDLYCVVDGTYEGANPALANGLEPVTRDVHRTWLYQVRGTPDPKTLDVHAYAGVLSATIDRILEKQMADPAPDTECPTP